MRMLDRRQQLAFARQEVELHRRIAQLWRDKACESEDGEDACLNRACRRDYRAEVWEREIKRLTAANVSRGSTAGTA